MPSRADWMNDLRRYLGLAVEWVFRKRSVGLRVMRCGAAFVLASLAGFTVSFRRGEDVLFFSSEAWLPLSIVVLFVGVVTLSLGLWLVLRDANEERAARERRRVLVVEQRGLQARFATPLRDALPPGPVGQRVEKVIDTSPYFRDGALADFGAAFMHVREARATLRLGLADTQPSDVTAVYGGVAPVPLTFLTGTYFDDLSRVIIMDWDRAANAWRALDGDDNGDGLSEPDPSLVPPGTDEVGLTISVSYAVDEDAARRILPGCPLLAMRMGQVEVGNHWSETKQRRMAEAFVRVMAKLADRGVRRVHLFLAAPNSVVFRLGRHLDRNWPAVQVYQREPGDAVRFPWSIGMPSCEAPEPQLCSTMTTAD